MTEQAPGNVVSRLKRFAAQHDGATAVLQNMGEEGVRITLVGGDGIMGDQIVANPAQAKDAAELVAVDYEPLASIVTVPPEMAAAWKSAASFTTSPARCATWCRTTSCKCCALPPWNAPNRWRPTTCATKNSKSSNRSNR